MEFIETLKSVGNVKPCDCDKELHDFNPDCPDCHGTGHVLNFAPLLAKPFNLEAVVERLFMRLLKVDSAHGWCSLRTMVLEHLGADQASLIVIGPQRASNLVYEVARQLGGTAVVAVEMEQPTTVIEYDSTPECQKGHKELRLVYRLSLPIPDNATVLFVTDRLDEAEMLSVIGMVRNPVRMLHYVLALVSDRDVLVYGARGAEEFKVISLHKG